MKINRFLKNKIAWIFKYNTNSLRSLYCWFKSAVEYNTWPKMGDQWVPESVYAMSPFWTNFTEGLAGIQFIHRTLAIVLLLFTIHIFIFSKKHKLSFIQKRSILLLLVIVLMQMIFGILTLVMGTPLYLSLMHQLLAFIMLMTLILNLFLLNVILNNLSITNACNRVRYAKK